MYATTVLPTYPDTGVLLHSITGSRTKKKEKVSNWILMFWQSHRVTSGWSNSYHKHILKTLLICKHFLKSNLSCTTQPLEPIQTLMQAHFVAPKKLFSCSKQNSSKPGEPSLPVWELQKNLILKTEQDSQACIHFIRRASKKTNCTLYKLHICIKTLIFKYVCKYLIPHH